MKIIVPPIKCQGIKTKIVPLILANAVLPTTGRWIEPFMGSGVVGFNSGCKRILFSDLNPHIINFYNALNSSAMTPKIVRDYLGNEGHNLLTKGESYYYEVRERFNQNKEPLDFLFLSRAGFNGVIRFNSKGYHNVPFCRKLNRFSKAYTTKIVNQVERVYLLMQNNDWEFQCRDFQEVIAEATEDDFVYCDPPYFGRHVDYFNTWTESDDEKLFNSMNQCRAKMILSTWHSNQYRTNPHIEKYWDKFNIITQNHFYHIGSKEKYRNPMIEALVLNYKPQEQEAVQEERKQLALL